MLTIFFCIITTSSTDHIFLLCEYKWLISEYIRLFSNTYSGHPFRELHLTTQKCGCTVEANSRSPGRKWAKREPREEVEGVVGEAPIWLESIVANLPIFWPLIDLATNLMDEDYKPCGRPILRGSSIPSVGREPWAITDKFP